MRPYVFMFLCCTFGLNGHYIGGVKYEIYKIENISNEYVAWIAMAHLISDSN